MTSDGPVIELDEAHITRLCEIFGSGVMSGIASLMGNHAQAAGASEEQVNEAAVRGSQVGGFIAAALLEDPLTRDQLRRDLLGIFHGQRPDQDFRPMTVHILRPEDRA